MTSLTDTEFSVKIGQIVEGSLIGMTLSAGCRVGLIQKLIELNGEPKTSVEIAESLGLRERYVREWLKAVLVAKVIESDSTGTKFYLPKGRGKGLLGPWNSVFFNFYPSLAGVYGEIVDCFNPTGPSGLPYSRYPTFAESFLATKTTLYESNFLNIFLPSMPGSICDKLESGIKVLDIACGGGDASIRMAKAFPKSTFIGVDFNESFLETAKKEAEQASLTNLSFSLMDATKLLPEWSEQFDFVLVIDGIHDMAYPQLCLKEIRRVLHPNGAFAMVDLALHTNPAENRDIPGAAEICALSLFHCLPVSLYHPNSEGLGNNWGMELARDYLSQAGFNHIEIIPNPKGFELSQFLAFCKK